MRFLIVLIFISQLGFANLESPRQTMQTFISSMVKVKNNDLPLKPHYEAAITTLDMDHKDPLLKYDIGKVYANKLIKAMDKIKKVNYEKIPLAPKESRWFFDKRKYKQNVIEISLVKKENIWLFSKETLLSLDHYEKVLQNESTVEGVNSLITITDYIRINFAPIFSKKFFLFFNWQWLGILAVILISSLLSRIFDKVLTIVLNRTFKIVQLNSNARLRYALRPLDKIIFWLIGLELIPYLEFNAKGLAVTERLLYILLSLYCVWFGHRMIELITYYFTQKAQKTETKFDDILIPLLSKSAYILVYIFGIVLIANALTINVTGIVAGLGIGGLAFAFAAKDTLANFFGSIMLVLDRPFDIGDVIVAGDVEGVVSEVGFRSTRIRTFNDSVITISNGELMNRPINNLGKRRYRRLVTTLGLEYDTPAEKIEAFCEGIRQIIINHRWTRKDTLHVYFESFGDFSLNIKMICYWETDDYSRELAEKHRLHIDILRLAEEVGVSFAFPTQTIHMFHEQKIEKENIQGEFRAVGREKGLNVVKKPLTLKNPRSNAEDKSQFGDNEIES